MPADKSALRKQWHDEVQLVMTSARNEMRARLGGVRVDWVPAEDGARPKFKLPLGLTAPEQRYASQVIETVWAQWEDRYQQVRDWEQWLLSHSEATADMSSGEFSEYRRRKRAARDKAKAEAETDG